MRKSDIAFLVCVLGCAGLFAARSMTHAIPLLSSGVASAPAATGAAGQPRNVDMANLKQLLDQGTLSEHEAEFYEPFEGTSRPTGGQNESDHVR